MIRALIVDDEPLARQRVRTLLADTADITVVGEAQNGEVAVARINALKPDIVFLDIEMPLMGGFDVVAAVGPDAMPVTVFLTAHDSFALAAFDAEALDYLTKPFDDRRFARMLDRLRERLRLRPPTTVTLSARVRGRTILIPVSNIDWIAAAGDYVEVHAGRDTCLVDEAIGHLASRLGPQDFIRIHRSTLVRADRIHAWQPSGHGDGVIVLKSGETLRVSRSFAAAVRAWLNTRRGFDPLRRSRVVTRRTRA